EDLGVRHRLWVYSGRRGVHCWVCDDAVRKWSPALRAAAVEYLSLVKVGARGAGHPCPSPLVDATQPPGWVGAGRVCMGWAMSVMSTTSLDRRAQHREALQGEFPKKRDSLQRWELLKGRMERTRVSERGVGTGRGSTCCAHPSLTHPCPQQQAGKGAPCYGDWEIMLQFCFPRLDINVSKGLGHLLKSPFSVHPKTGGAGTWPHGEPPKGLGTPPSFPSLSGRVSVPLDLQHLERFDPFAVPTISSLCQELDAAGEDAEQEESSEAEPKRRARDYRRTSLAPYVRIFEQFVEEMEHARRGELLRRSGACQAPMELPGDA
ncbi:PRI1 primase, partial [Centropus unirufus]|nr:PRI1 primase [Centropus unirufus]